MRTRGFEPLQYVVMRFLPFAALLLLLAGCASTALYQPVDTDQVRTAAAEIVPVYEGFKQAYLSNNGASLAYWYGREQNDCKLVDVIDKRDSIDPNIKLFAASENLDDLCNDIEVAWAYWAKQHHMKYESKLVPAVVTDAWVDGDKRVALLPELMAHPSQLA